MVVLKTKTELGSMRRAGAITAGALLAGGAAVTPGATTQDIADIVHEYIKRHGAIPSFLGYGGFPGACCVSVNDEVIHGIPGPRVLQDGDIVSIDVGALIEGFHGDSARTFACGTIPPETQALLDATELALSHAIEAARAGSRIGDISWAVQSTVEPLGFTVVREYVGHGVGRKLHEGLEVPNYGSPGHGVRLMPGMTIAIEPMVNAGAAAIRLLSDNWTVKTRDGQNSAHFEHTIAVTSAGPVMLTAPD